jgi:prolyl-tRNA synthetase
VPIRLEIGPREAKAKSVTLVRRDTGDKTSVPLKGMVEAILKQGEMLTRNLRKEADSYFKSNIRKAANLEELRKAIAKGGFVRCGFCSVSIEGVPCAERVKDELHGDVRGERADTLLGTGRKEKPSGKCVVCGKPAKHVVYIGKQY